MKKDFPIEDEWLPYEIHPDTPEKGVFWAEYFPGMKPEQFFNQLDARGRDMGIRFGSQPLMSNSRKALEVGEFAKVHGKYEAYHEAIFHAFFTKCKDIGNEKVILDAAQSAGLDTRLLQKALEDHEFFPVLQKTTEKARQKMVTAAPTFIFSDQETITGAQPIEEFQRVLKK